MLNKVNQASDFILKWVFVRLGNLTMTTRVILVLYALYKVWFALQHKVPGASLHSLAKLPLYKWELVAMPLLLALSGICGAAICGHYKQWGAIAGGRFSWSTGLVGLVIGGLVLELGFTQTGIGLLAAAILLVRRWNTLMILSVGFSILAAFLGGSSGGGSRYGGSRSVSNDHQCSGDLSPLQDYERRQ
jgi:hypothetical protein